jgi:hypothetical protein
METKKLKEYTYYFIGGGWNSEWAYTKAQAKKQAIAKGWGHEIDMDSFHIASKEETKSLLSLFY